MIRSIAPAPLLAALVLAIGAAACGGSEGEAKTPDDNGPIPMKPSTVKADAPTPEGKSKKAEGGLNEAQEEQMIVALRRGGEKAAQCADVVPDAPRGEGSVDVVFDGEKGRIVDASVGAPWAGTAVEACIKRSFIGEIVLPFDGPQKSVPYTVTLPAKAAAATKDAKAGKDAKPGKDAKAPDGKK